ncbi:hypothetical protein NE562_00750 [Butyricicoccus faecihominis]|uniref:hypothetical protein n=1 Tax=Butyricicoccus faecihominis TaxID=1712515 RepID=UPI00247A99B6|nr:hypothetical protein [Butyricicoccus faecihominis]MCQ5128169.1 hypothetical protein [Butyricicoccus faecihominis]
MSEKVCKHKTVKITLEPDGYSIHTFELSRKLTSFEWQRTKDELYRQCKGEIYPDKSLGDDHVCTRYAKFGVRLRLEHRESKSGPTLYHVRMIINPRRLIDPNSDYLGILTPKKKSIDRLERAFHKLFEGTPIGCDIRDYYLSRVDLCTNIRCANRKVFRELIRLLRKTATPKKYERKQYRHQDKKKANRYNKHYIRLCCGSQELVVYDKTYQLNDNGAIVAYENLPEGILRVEVHYDRSQIKKTEKDLQNENPLEILWLLIRESKRRILSLVGKCYPDLCYRSFEEGVSRIQQSAFQQSSRERMQTLLGQMQRKQTVDAAFKWMRARNITTDDLLVKFTKLGLNPIPLRKGCAAKRMPSLPEILRTVEDHAVEMELEYWKWK